MNEEKQVQLNKLQTFADHEMLAIFNALGDLNDNISKVIQAVESSKQTQISVDNLSDLQLDLTPLEASFDTLKGTSQGIITAIKGIKDVDMSGVEKLLSKIADKEDKDIDVTELSNISIILEDVLLAVQTTSSATNLTPEKGEELKPDLEKIQNILNALNDNLVAFDVPDFDYKRLERIIKDNLNITVSGGGGNAVGLQQSTAVTMYNVALTVADTEYSQILPSTTKKIQVNSRTTNDIRYSYETGKVATPTSPYSTIPAGMVYFEEGLVANLTIYLASGTTGDTAEITVWT